MKVLVTYSSQTGNTEQIAKAVHQEASQSHEAELSKIDEVNATSLNKYDLIFVGSPIHAGGLTTAANEFLGLLPEASKLSLAGFVTHAAPAYNRESFEKGIMSLEKISQDKGITFLGCYNCQGRLAPAIQPMVQQARKVPDDEWAKIMEETDKHPDAEDELKAKEFARQVLSKI